MTEPQDPQSPPSYPSYPGNQQPAQPGDASGQTPYPAAPAGSYPNQPYQQPGMQTDPGKRPGAVTAAGWITMILSLLTVLTSVIAFAASNDASEEIHKRMEENPDDFNIDASDIPTLDELQGIVTGGGVVLLVIGLVGILLGFLVLRRQGWARILLLITTAITAIVALFASFVLVGVPWLVGSVTVFVLLLGSKANAWFKAGRA